MALKGMMQGQQLQNVQLQQQQLALQDQKVLRTSSQGIDWTQPDAFDKLLTAAQKNGVSPQTMQQIATSRQTFLKSVADTDEATNKANMQRNTMLLGHLDAIKGITDPDQRAAQAKLQASQILTNGLVKDPQTLGQIQAIAQGQKVPTDDELSMVEAGLTDHNTQIEQHLKVQQTAEAAAKAAEATAAAGKTNLELDYMKKYGGITPAMAESRYLSITQKQNQGMPISAEDTAFKKSYEHMKTLVPAFNFNLQAAGVPGTGTAPAGPSGQPLQGDALLQTFGAKGPIIKAISEGRMTLPSSFALKSPYWQDTLNKLALYDPQFSEQRAELRKGYTVGAQSKEINAINTALGHVGVLGDSIDALSNGNVQVLNKIANSVGAQVGQTPQTTLKTIINRVGPELVKAYNGSGGGVGERQAAEEDFSPDKSPAQLQANVAMTAKLLRSKIGSLENQWNQNAAPGTPNFQDRFLMPQARAVADKWAPGAEGGKGGVIYARDPQGKLHQAPAGTALPAGWKQENK
jgi:hypothetical protein